MRSKKARESVSSKGRSCEAWGACVSLSVRSRDTATSLPSSMLLRSLAKWKHPRRTGTATSGLYMSLSRCNSIHVSHCARNALQLSPWFSSIHPKQCFVIYRTTIVSPTLAILYVPFLCRIFSFRNPDSMRRLNSTAG